MTSHDNVTDIVERLVAEKYESDEHGIWAIPRNPEGREAAQVIATLRKQLENAREALVKCQWELETIDRTQSTNFRRVQELILANREALKGQP